MISSLSKRLIKNLKTPVKLRGKIREKAQLANTKNEETSPKMLETLNG